MALELDTTGPGTEAYRSSRYAVTVNGVAQYVYAYERTAGFTNLAFTSGQSYELSWLKFGASEATTIVVSLADATPITSAVVYPKNVAQGVSINEDGTLSFIVAANKYLWIEVNGNRAEPLLVFARPLKQVVPGTSTNWNTLGVTVSSIDTVNDRIVFSGVHGLVAGDRFVLASTGDMPSDTEGTWERWEPFYVTEVDGLEISVGRNAGDSLDLLTAGSGTMRVIKTSYTNSASALYFGAGVHYIGRSFTLGSNVNVYLDRGAILVGGFKYPNTSGITIQGPGQISGEHTTYEEIFNLGFAARVEYSMLNGFGDADGYSTNTVQGITVFAAPFYHSTGSVYSFNDVQLVSPWTYNTDGFITERQNSTTNATEVVSCFSYIGDDTVHLLATAANRVARDSMFVSSSSAIFHFGYWPTTASRSFGMTITNCDVMSLDNGSAAIFRNWSDGYATQASHGVFDVDVSDIRVWGPLAIKLFDFTNTRYPFGEELARNMRGQFAFNTFDNIWVEDDAPGEISLIQGLDAVSTPHDLTFTNVTFGDVLLTAENASTYILFNSHVYNIRYETPTDPVDPDPVEPAFVVETGAGLSNANALCSVADVDTFNGLFNESATWSALTRLQKERYIRLATRWLSSMRYDGAVTKTTQALPFPRVGLRDRNEVLQDSDEVPSLVIQTCAEAAILLSEGSWTPFPVLDGDAAVMSESISIEGGVSFSQTFARPRTTESARPTSLMLLINPFLEKVGGRVYRG